MIRRFKNLEADLKKKRRELLQSLRQIVVSFYLMIPPLKISMTPTSLAKMIS